MLKKEISVTVGSNVFSTALSLGTSIILARMLGRADRGLLGLALLLPMVMATFCSFGMPTVNATFAGLYKDQRRHLFQQSLLITLFGAVLSAVLILAFFFWLPIPLGQYRQFDHEMVYLVIVMTPLMILGMVLPTFVNGVGRITLSAAINAGHAMLSFVLLLGFMVFWHGRIKTALIVMAVDRLLIILLSLWAVRDYVSLRVRHFSGAMFRKSMGFGAKVSLSTLAGFLLYRLDQGILNYMVSDIQIGLYVVAVGMAEKLKLLPNSIASAFLPRLANEWDNRQGQVPRVFRYTTIISFGSMLVLGIVGIPATLVLYGYEYAGMIPSFLWLLPGIAVLGGSSIISSDLTAREKPLYVTVTGFFTLTLNVVLNLLLIPKMGIAGSAVASSISYAAAHGMVLYFYRRESKVPLGRLIPRGEDFRFVARNL
ncbi:MAG: oligosaccharide flippase family protein, partial [Sedimentisphaerales bacterium]|nr:oligosaccharide flippase family protein [Sedimentisphaerales bacterium]